MYLVSEGIPDIAYHDLFVPMRFVPWESATLALTLTLTLALTPNSNTNPNPNPRYLTLTLFGYETSGTVFEDLYPVALKYDVIKTPTTSHTFDNNVTSFLYE